MSKSLSITVQGAKGKVTVRRSWRVRGRYERITIKGTPPREALARILDAIDTLEEQGAANG